MSKTTAGLKLERPKKVEGKNEASLWSLAKLKGDTWKRTPEVWEIE